jgi:hypothetical protein
MAALSLRSHKFPPMPAASRQIFSGWRLMTVIGSIRETVTWAHFVGTYNYRRPPSRAPGWLRISTSSGVHGAKRSAGREPRTGSNAAETGIDQNAIFWAEFRVLRTGPTTNVVFLNTQQGTARLVRLLVGRREQRLDGSFPAGTNRECSVISHRR